MYVNSQLKYYENIYKRSLKHIVNWKPLVSLDIHLLNTLKVPGKIAGISTSSDIASAGIVPKAPLQIRDTLLLESSQKIEEGF